MKIGVFDSGIGGLTVLKEIDALIGGATLYYYGDNLNAPYGGKSEEEILSLSRPAFDEFLSLGVSAAVVACNTVTAVCIKALRALYPYKIIGMEPAVLPAVRAYGGAVVLCTRATAQSQRFKSLLCRAGGVVSAYVPQKLAGDIEAHDTDLNGVRLFNHFYPPFFKKFPCAVLGCTHYVLLKNRISEYLSLPVIDGNHGTALHLVNVLTTLGYKTDAKKRNEIIFLNLSKKHNKSVFESLKMF